MKKRIVNAHNRGGSDLVLKKEWITGDVKNFDEYLWECVIKWPYGFCILRLRSNNGTVTYEFDTDDLVPVKEYIRSSNRYSYQLS